MALAIMVTSGCKKPYLPPVISATNSYLVIEGLINSGADSTFIKLTRTVKLSGKSAPAPELNAVVTVESDQNNTYTLEEAGNGLYQSAPLNLSSAAKYRLRVKTSDNKEYVSDFVEAKVTPAIDSISYSVANNGVQFEANTHDPTNNTRYYRWDFDETWQYISFYQSFYKLDPTGYPTYRIHYNGPDNIYQCFATAQSHQILLGSSAKLTNDVIAQQPVDFISAGSGKISHGYSVMLRQYALTSAGFSYWQNVKKNTEQLGSIFDAQPSTLQGNIHCISNPAEPVIGFVSASSVTAKRLYVDNHFAGLFVPFYVEPPDAGACPIKAIMIAPEVSFQDRLNQIFRNGDTVLVNAIQPNGAPAIIGYSYAWNECVDCRTKQPYGTNTHPVFWPY
ncbi:MAG: DUF4249 domain-containing protein [Sphingobacteriales bacterium]